MIYDRVKELARKKGLTITQMENDVGLSRGNTCKWNNSPPRISTLQRVADYFGVSIEYFLK